MCDKYRGDVLYGDHEERAKAELPAGFEHLPLSASQHYHPDLLSLDLLLQYSLF